MNTVRFVLGGTTLAAGGYLLGSSLKSRKSDALPIDSPRTAEYKYIHSHPQLESLRQKNQHESMYYDMIPKQHRKNMLTSGLLAGEGALTVEPFVFTNKTHTEMTFFYHIGKQVEGHEGIVHGGLLATIMDEALSRCAFPSLPNKYGVTANLDLNYKAPVKTSSYLMLKTRVVESHGRKCKVEGELLTLDDEKTLMTGTAVMVEPKWAKYFIWLLK